MTQKSSDEELVPIAQPSTNSKNGGDSKIPEVKMNKSVGLMGCLSFVVGVMIGSGIFASPKSVFSKAGSVGMGLLVWAACGVLAMLGSLCYVELGCTIRESGGERTYLSRAFHKSIGFLYSWTAILVLKPATLAGISLAFAQYVLEPFFPGCGTDPMLTPMVKLLAAFALGVVLLVNSLSVNLATRVQVIFTAAKLLAIVTVIMTGIVRLCQGHVSNFRDGFAGTSSNVGDIGFALYGGLWAYDGWNNLNYVLEELSNPIRDLPLSILIGIPLVTGCYVLVNIAYLTVLPYLVVSTSTAVAVTLANMLYGVMAWVMPVFVACSTFGAANGNCFASSRIVFVTARSQQMPQFFGMIHRKRQTPIPGLFLVVLIAWIMLIPDSSDFETMINYFNFAAWMFYGSTVASLLWLRWKEPELPRPFKVWIVVPIIVVLCAVYLVIAPFSTKPVQSSIVLLFILMGLPVYYIFIARKMFRSKLDNWMEWLTFRLEAICDLTPVGA